MPGPPLCCGLDWDPYDGQKTGAVSAYNIVLFHTLTEAAWLERHLGNRAEARALEAEATALRRAINEHLLDPATGLYRISDTNGGLAQDANSLAVLWGVAPPARRAGILAALKSRLWTPVGVKPFSDDSGFQTAILSPFATGFETGARLESGDTRGVAPLSPGYRTWRVAPHPGDLRWAAGQVPSAYGPIRVRWLRRPHDRLLLRVTAPRGTSGTVVLPRGHRAVDVEVNGRPLPGARAPGSTVAVSGGP